MTYQQMRTLFACLARYDGRLSVLTARSQEPFEQWAVCLCDHVRQTWRWVGGLGALTASAHGRARAPRERPLAALPALPQTHGATLTWLDVLRVLDVLERGTSCWLLAEIVATRPAQGAPRYWLVLRNEGGAGRCEVDSYAAFEQIVGAGPGGQGRPA